MVACFFFYFFNTSYICNSTPSFAAHHKHVSARSCWVQGTAVAALTCVSFLCENHKGLNNCRLTFVEAVFLFLIRLVNLEFVVVFSLWLLFAKKIWWILSLNVIILGRMVTLKTTAASVSSCCFCANQVHFPVWLWDSGASVQKSNKDV